MSGRPIGEQAQAPASCLPYDPRAKEVARRVAGMINYHSQTLAWSTSVARPFLGARERV